MNFKINFPFLRIISVYKNKIIFLYKCKKMKIFIKKGSNIDPSVEIGRCTRINNISHIGPCKIGSFCAIGGRLVVRSSDHDTSYLNMQDWAQKKIIRSKLDVAGKDKGPVTIGNAVWIGDSVVILPGVKVGDGAVIGAGSVVTHSIPSFSIAVGNPARVIKKRFDDKIIDRIEKINWWDWDDQMIHQRKELFEINLKKITIENLDLLLKRYHL